jgi:hypothetical protein
MMVRTFPFPVRGAVAVAVTTVTATGTTGAPGHRDAETEVIATATNGPVPDPTPRLVSIATIVTATKRIRGRLRKKFLNWRWGCVVSNCSSFVFHFAPRMQF